MRKSFVAAVVGLALAVPGTAVAKAPTGPAVPARTVVFQGGECTAKFVRSASGIVNETDRICGNWTDGYWLQFRPLAGKPDPACDPEGLALSFYWTNAYDPAVADYTRPGEWFNVCWYPV